MSHTPEEAEKLWCAHMTPDDSDDRTCISEKCMAWRWIPKKESRQMTGKSVYACVEIQVDAKSTHGYCGLAGKP